MSNSLFDTIMPFFHKPNVISIIFFLIICIIIFNKNLKQNFLNEKIRAYNISGVKILLCIILSVILSDQIGGTIKKLELRERPWVNKSIDQMNCLTCKVDKNNPNLYSKNIRSANKSFPSNHAANTFSLAIIVSFFLPKFKKILFGLAFIISFSRIYIGVHYPFDIVFGIGLGILSSYLVKLIFNLYIRKVN